jgi:uncharacterized membrane-anchored protein
MAAQLRSVAAGQEGRLLSKVPEVILAFWIIKILCTTVGETAADFLNSNLGLGLDGTTVVMTLALAGILAFQFRARSYTPSLYWLAVVMISIVGTLITDNLVDNFGVPLETTTVIFGAALALTFVVWFARERTLSIHSIHTRQREAFYWLAILFTFAVGTAAGDLVAEQLNLGYLVSGLIFIAVLAAIAVGHLQFGLNAVLAFWMAYVVTRPLGASLGDYLSQPRADSGLGLGTTVTSALFLSAILALVVYLVVTRADQRRPEALELDAID